jgi:TetR/AcrR family transcriptional repressor of nem operon
MGRPRAFDEPEVMRRAQETFHDRGYTATSVEDLTAATGLNRSSLYSAFGDKRGLFMASFAQYCDEDARLIEAELGGDDAGALTRIRAHLRAKTADPAASARGCLLAKATAELGSADPDVAGMARRFYEIYEAALVSAVRQAQAAGDLRDDMDASDAGALLLAVLRGIESLGRGGHAQPALETIADSALASLRPVALAT